MKYAWIDAQRRDFGLDEICAALDVSESGYRPWKRGGKPHRKRLTDAQMLALIQAIHVEFKGAYGSRRMVRKHRLRGFPASKERVEQLMQENGIKAKHKRRFKVTTDSKHNLPVAPNLLDRHFTPAPPIRSGHLTSPTCGKMTAGCIWRLCSTCSIVKWRAGRVSRA